MNDFTQQQAELVQKFLVWRFDVDAQVSFYEYPDTEKKVFVKRYHVALWAHPGDEYTYRECFSTLSSLRMFQAFHRFTDNIDASSCSLAPCPLTGEQLESIGVDPNFDTSYAVRKLQNPDTHEGMCIQCERTTNVSDNTGLCEGCTYEVQIGESGQWEFKA